MKLYKLSELALTIILLQSILFSFILSFYEIAFCFYIVAGSLQFISMIIHKAKGWFTNHSPRNIYHFAFVLSLLLSLSQTGIIVSLYSSPVLLSLYAMICYREIQIIKLKEFVHLK